ncbi:MAG: hypothetical protein AAB618_02870 [Patescibacteria group bacterium]
MTKILKWQAGLFVPLGLGLVLFTEGSAVYKFSLVILLLTLTGWSLLPRREPEPKQKPVVLGQEATKWTKIEAYLFAKAAKEQPSNSSTKLA